MIELIMFGLGILTCFTFYGVFHLYPKKKDVKGDKKKKIGVVVDSNKTFEMAHQEAVEEVRRLGLLKKGR